MSANDTYQTPLCGRYSSKEMQHIFSSRNRFSTWRKLWLWYFPGIFTSCIVTDTHFRLAEAEQELGIEEITDEALVQIRKALVIEDEEFAIAADHERKVRHDVMVEDEFSEPYSWWL
jgi:adenylosuccinate lyase